MYGKIFERVFTGSMFGSGPVVFSVWAYVIANTKPPGVVELNPKLLAACIGTSTEEVREAIAFLCRADPESQNADEDGRRLVQVRGHEYHVISFDKYRKMQSAEDRREYHREYWHRRQHSTALNNTQHDSTNSTEAEAEAEAEAKKKSSATKGSRFTLTQLPEDWKSFCKANRPDLNPASVFDAFSDYWRAVPGAKGVKLDWFATWRNWVRSQKAAPVGVPQVKPWHESAAGTEAKGRELGLDPDRFVTPTGSRDWQAFRSAVLSRAGVTQ